MSRSLSIDVRLHDGRYHGVPDWPPAPARLFQALVAGTARGAEIATEDQVALKWLEALPAPIIAVPTARQGRGLVSYVPNNDLDSVSRDPGRAGEIRAAKSIRPHLFDASVPLRYHWTFPESDADEQCARSICRVADRLYQLGRGVDMAWAHAEVIDAAEAESRLTEFPSIVHRPCDSDGGDALACPEVGSLESLVARHVAQRTRLRSVVVGRRGQQVFSQPPKPRFRQVAYNSPSTFRLYDLITLWPFVKCAELANHVRDAAADRLSRALPDKCGEIDRVLIGREATEADKAARVRVLPLPSIGHQHADRAIRRVLVEIPPNCPIRADDVEWALSGLNLEVDEETGEVRHGLVAAVDSKMLGHYGIGVGRRARRWRTVTAAALPTAAARRRIDPRRIREESKGGAERLAETNRAAGAVVQALRHADIRGRVTDVRVQREPFDAKGACAEVFAEGTRFAKERLWHVEIEFADPVSGPVIIGDGRYMGLGLMAPAKTAEQVNGVHCFQIVSGLTVSANPVECARALRRAVMARVQDQIGVRNTMPTFFTGHESDGAPARSGAHSHLAFVADTDRKRLLILPPHVIEHRSPTWDERKFLVTLDEAVRDLVDLRAGKAGRLILAGSSISTESDSLFATAQLWECVAPYHVTRHAKRMTPQEAIAADVQSEIRRLMLPIPTSLEVIEMCEGARGGLSGRVRLRFKTAVKGPILVGRTRHLGGGLFVVVE